MSGSEVYAQTDIQGALTSGSGSMTAMKKRPLRIRFSTFISVVRLPCSREMLVYKSFGISD